MHIGGEKDTIIPSKLSQKNAEAYKDKNSISDFKEFKGKSHFICGDKGWEEVAGFVHDWILKLK